MADAQTVTVPDIGEFDEVDVVEVLVRVGQHVDPEQSLITLESDKATLEVPSPAAGTVEEVKVAIGDKVAEGSPILTLRPDPSAAGESMAAADERSTGKEPPASPERAAPESPGESRPAAPQAATPSAGTPDIETQLVVLGSGPGGYAAAFRAADLGMDVTLVERYPDLGGICLNVGCIPSKALLHAAKVITDAGDMAQHGVRFGEPEVDPKALRSWKSGVVKKLTDGLASMAKRRKVRVVQGSGRFTSANELTVEGESTQLVRFEQAVIAAGSQSAKLPELPDDPRIMDSTAALEVEEIPGRLLVVGGGIIGLEMACMYAGLGSEVTVVELTDTVMPGTDRDLVKPLQKRLEKRHGARIHTGTGVAGIKANKKALKVSFEGEKAPKQAEFDRALVAVGRRPNGDRIGAENAGVRVGERGVIEVDQQMRTSARHIYAIGDLVAGPMLAHKATYEGRLAAEVAAGHRRAFDARVVPSVAYTDPEVGWVGVTEEDAKARGLDYGKDYGKGVFPWAASGRALGMSRDEGQTKLLFDERTGRLIGAGVVGPGAGDLIAELALAIEMGCDAEDIALTIHPHPTLAESVMMAAEAYEGTITDLYMPRRR